MMQQIGDEMEKNTRAISQPSYQSKDMNILDLCMAPGGYTASALKYNPGASTCGISLPVSQGGHEVFFKSLNTQVLYLDITMLANEFGVEAIPDAHPERLSFIQDRPWLGKTFQLVFCDGQVLRTHQRARYREQCEASRLTVSQLILALQRIRPGGTLIMLLHKVEAWVNAELLFQFHQFSTIQLFKPQKKHAIRSSFYLIASNIQPDSAAAKAAVETWKSIWYRTTFGIEEGAESEDITVDDGRVNTVIDQFGSTLLKLGRPIWEIQANALSKADFVK